MCDAPISACYSRPLAAQQMKSYPIQLTSRWNQRRQRGRPRSGPLPHEKRRLRRQGDSHPCGVERTKPHVFRQNMHNRTQCHPARDPIFSFYESLGVLSWARVIFVRKVERDGGAIIASSPCFRARRIVTLSAISRSVGGRSAYMIQCSPPFNSFEHNWRQGAVHLSTQWYFAAAALSLSQWALWRMTEQARASCSRAQQPVHLKSNFVVYSLRSPEQACLATRHHHGLRQLA